MNSYGRAQRVAKRAASVTLCLLLALPAACHHLPSAVVTQARIDGADAAKDTCASVAASAPSENKPAAPPSLVKNASLPAAVRASRPAGESSCQPISVPDALRERIEAICRAHCVIGLTIAAFKDDNLFYTQSFGYADVDRKIPACDHTKYRIASISKTITGLMVTELAANGAFGLDDPVSDYLGVNLDNPNFPDDKITIRQLMTHTSGIYDCPGFYEASRTPIPLRSLLSRGKIHSWFRPGTDYLYTNFGAGLLSAVVEKATGQRFYDYADQTLFDPLGMDASFLSSRIDDTQNLAQIYQNKTLSVNLKQWHRNGGMYDAIPLGEMYLIGQCDLIISAPDLAVFAMALAGDGTAGGKRILREDSVREMNAVQFSNDAMTRGLCLHINDRLVEGRVLRGHLGQSLGMLSGMYYDPADRTGVVFITNGCSQYKNKRGNYAVSEDLVNAVYSSLFDAAAQSEESAGSAAGSDSAHTSAFDEPGKKGVCYDRLP